MKASTDAMERGDGRRGAQTCSAEVREVHKQSSVAGDFACGNEQTAKTLTVELKNCAKIVQHLGCTGGGA